MFKIDGVVYFVVRSMKEKRKILMVEFLSKKGIFFVDLNELLEVNAFLV